MKKHYLIALSGLLLISSCKKDETTDEGNLLSKKLAISNRILATANLSNPFDWETVQVMPTAPNQPQIFPPWGSGASRQITEEIIQDYKSVDGWELVYNTFSITVIPSHYYFTLYNKYRGVMRMYYYNPSSATSIASSNIVHTLLSAGSAAAGSPIMNYAASDIVDYATNVTTASTIEQWQVAPGTWYAFEYEMAYDKNLSA